MSIFAASNPTTFAFYPLFIGIYGLSILTSIFLKIYKKRTNTKLIQFNKTIRNTSFWLAIYGTIGFLLLLSRYAYIHFLSMEALHILNFLLLLSLTAKQLFTFKKLNFK